MKTISPVPGNLRSAGTILVVASWLLSIGVTWADPVNAQRGTAAVRGWLKVHGKPLGETLGGAVERVETFRDAAGGEAYHVVYLKPSGFVIVAADDLVEPVICFAPSGTFEASESNQIGRAHV